MKPGSESSNAPRRSRGVAWIAALVVWLTGCVSSGADIHVAPLYTRLATAA